MNLSSSSESDAPDDGPVNPGRRTFFGGLAGLFMAGGLVAGYGTFLSYMARFLFPAKGQKKGWLFLAELTRMEKGHSMTYRAPTGEKIAVARQAETGDVSDFVALSSTCPHLGCQVHWEGNNDRFFCPCHNGVFDPSGKAVAGPPADAKQDLPRYNLKIEKGLLYIEVPLEGLSGSRGAMRQVNMPSRGDEPRFLRGAR